MMKQKYAKVRLANQRSGHGPTTMDFYAELHALVGDRPSITTPYGIDMDTAVRSANADLDSSVFGE